MNTKVYASELIAFDGMVLNDVVNYFILSCLLMVTFLRVHQNNVLDNSNTGCHCIPEYVNFISTKQVNS